MEAISKRPFGIPGNPSGIHPQLAFVGPAAASLHSGSSGLVALAAGFVFGEQSQAKL